MKLDFLSVVIEFAGAESDDFPFLRLFLGGIGNDDTALFYFLLFERLHEHPVSERSYVTLAIGVGVFIAVGWFLVIPASA